MPEEKFEAMLSGGHPNSLGRTVEVVERVLSNKTRLAELFDCYDSEDAVVRLRTSNALKRICRAQPESLVSYLDRLLKRVSQIDQASAQWTLATLFLLLAPWMNPRQRKKARQIMQRNLEHHQDWIVLNTTMDTLAQWADQDSDLRSWLLPQLQKLRHDKRRSVARKAVKISTRLSE